MQKKVKTYQDIHRSPTLRPFLCVLVALHDPHIVIMIIITAAYFLFVVVVVPLFADLLNFLSFTYLRTQAY